MKTLLKDLAGRRSIVIASVVIVMVALATISFFQGMRYERRNDSIKDATSLCFQSFVALRGFQDPKARQTAVYLLDRNVDIGALDLAELCLSHPGKIQREHYNMLTRVRDYRRTHGRDPQRTSGNDVSLGNGMEFLEFPEIDRRIDRAIALLESLHDTNNWSPTPLLQSTGEKTE